VAIGVVEVLEELTDEDVGEGEDEEEAGPSDTTSAREGIRILVDALVRLYLPSQSDGPDSAQIENSALELAVDNLSRLSETEEAERNGVFHTLGAHLQHTPLFTEE
jgi:beta-catenin-like protein 1